MEASRLHSDANKVLVRRVFQQVAATLRLQIAGIERRHGWNRTHSTKDSGLPTYIAKYVNYEASLLCKARQLALSSQAGLPPAIVGDRPAVNDGSDGHRIGKSALQMYRDDWLAARKARGVQEGWKASMWGPITQGFNNLTPAEKNDCERRSRDSKLNALRVRHVIAAKQRARPGLGAGVLPALPAAAAPQQQQQLALEDRAPQANFPAVSATSWMASSSAQLEVAAAEQPQESTCLASTAAHVCEQRCRDLQSAHPLSADKFDVFLQNLSRGTRYRQGGLRGAQHRFEVRARRMVSRPSHAPQFPDRVDYQESCEAFCSHSATPPGIHTFYRVLLGEVSKVIGGITKLATHASRESPLFLFEVCLEEKGG